MHSPNGGSDSGTNDERAPAPVRANGAGRGITGMLQIVGIIVGVGLIMAFSREDDDAPAVNSASSTPVRGTPEPDPIAPPLVRVMVPERTEMGVTIDATGTVEVRSFVELAPRIGGPVVSVSRSLRSGGEFEAGEVLFTIDPSDYELAVEQAQAELAATLSRLRLRQAEAAAARENYALLHGNVPVPDLVAKVPQIQQSEADVAGARARLARAELDLSRTEFTLPFDGRVVDTSVSVGQLLSKGQSSGQAFSLDAVEVAVPISTHELQRLQPVEGRNALVRLDGQTFQATVDRTSATLDERSRFARLYLTLADQTELAPGTFVDVALHGPLVPDVFVLPEASEQPSAAVWVVRQGALRQLTPHIYGRTTDGLVVRVFDYGEGVVLGSIPGSREGLRVATPDVEAGMIGVGG